MPAISPGPVVSGQCTSRPNRLTDKTARLACSECRRRKQRCTGRWPCYHCQKRKIAEQCRFMQAPAANSTWHVMSKQRSCVHRDDALPTSPECDSFDNFDCFKFTGYLQSDFSSSILSGYEKKRISTRRHCFKTSASCPQLRRALQELPSRTTTDALVQNFLGHVNFQSYIIHPSTFLEEYCNWWANRQANKALDLQWTCLLLTICACSTQQAPHQSRRMLEFELGEQLEKVSDRYHCTARELHGAIPIGCWDITSVQLLMHSCLWYMCEARFIQSWHALNVGIRLAQELRIDQEKMAGTISEFDCEMRRRLWCLLDTWDWQISSLLSRPRVIDCFDCDVGQPNLALEDYLISPLLHVKLQSFMIDQLLRRFGTIEKVTSPSQIKEYIRMVGTWMDSFPPQLDAYNPDISLDWKHEWLPLHRYILHCAGYQTMLIPLRPYLSRHMSLQSPMYELQLRVAGVEYALRFLHSLIGFFNRVYLRDATFQVLLFCVFDVSAILCSTIMHDGDGSLSRREDIAKAIQESIDVLTKLGHITWTAETLRRMIARIAFEISLSPCATADFRLETLCESELSAMTKIDLRELLSFGDEGPLSTDAPKATATEVTCQKTTGNCDSINAVSERTNGGMVDLPDEWQHDWSPFFDEEIETTS